MKDRMRVTAWTEESDQQPEADFWERSGDHESHVESELERV
jgi:hypothetical protein